MAYLRGDHLYVLTSPGDWAEARAMAQALGGDLVSIGDGAENDDLRKAFGGGFWIGYSDAAQEGQWRWSNGSSSGFSQWGSGEPNGGTAANAAWMHPNLAGRWDDTDANGRVLPGLAEIPVIQRHRRAYLLAEADSIEALRQLAALVGGELATIATSDTNDWLKRELPALVKRRTGLTAEAWGRHPLIGLSNPDGQGRWNWESGQALALAPWAPGEPSDGGQQEPYAQLLLTGPDAGRWNDSSFNGLGLIAVPLRTNQPARGLPTLNGIAQVGVPLNVSTQPISDADGLGTLAIQWQRRLPDRRGWQPISGATGGSYTPSATDLGLALRAVVSFRDKGEHEESLASAATTPVAAAPLRTSLALAPIQVLAGGQAALEVQRSGDRSSALSATLRWPARQLPLLSTGPLVEQLPGALRLQLQAGSDSLPIPFRASGLQGAGFVQWELEGLAIDAAPGVDARWLQARTPVRVLDANPLPAALPSLLPAPPVLPAASANSTLHRYHTYLLTYGPTLLESWRQEGAVLQSHVWGQQHYLGSGRWAGRQLEAGGDSMDWGAAVLFAPGLYQQWQQARAADPDLSAFNWGRANTALVRQAGRVQMGREQENDRLQGHLVFGLSGNDVLTGTQANDLLVGGFGDDVLTGGGLGGEDWFYGGPGRDQFVIDGGGTVQNGGSMLQIRDYTPAEDSLLLVNGLQRQSVRLELGQGGDHSLLLHSDGRLLAQLAGVTPSQVQLVQG